MDDFQNEKVIFLDQFYINDLAFQASITFGDEWGFDALGGQRSEPKNLELVHALARGVATSHHGFCQLHRRDVDDAFVAGLEAGKGVVPIADHAAHERRGELHHQVPGHGHDVRPTRANCGKQHDRPRFEEPINF